MRVRFRPEAADELGEACERYAKIEAALAQRFLAEVERMTTLILDQPHIGREVTPQLRRSNLRTFPYFLLYAVEGDEIVIAVVGHQSRKPGYWLDR